MHALYISYDGMTDPLGQSQVIPYLVGLRQAGHALSLLSCEKPDRFQAGGAKIRKLLEAAGIRWFPQTYHARPPVISTVYDLLRLRFAAARVHAQEPVDLVHCRSYPPALIGSWMAKTFGCRFVFDMRGFWPDERVEGGIWNLKHPLYRLIYRFFKHKEVSFLNSSDAIVTLTRNAKDEILSWGLPAVHADKITVIPCCADLGHFSPNNVEPAKTEQFRRELGLRPDDYIVMYLGSVGTWYMLDEMLAFFRHLLRRRREAKLLFLSPDSETYIRGRALAHEVPPESVLVRYCDRSDLPSALALADLGLYFIRPCFSKRASSPTKMGEMLGMGLPIVTNSGVGDSDWILGQYRLGAVVPDFTPEAYEAALDELERGLPASAQIRRAAEEQFSLAAGVASYARIYTAAGPAVSAPMLT